MNNYIGIDIGGSKCAVILGNENGTVIKKIRFDTGSPNETLNRIISETAEIGSASAIGISCGGPLNSAKGIIMSPPNLVGWDDIHIVKMLEDKLGIPAFLQNDADACALAEWRFGAGVGTQNMVFLTFGTGLGAGLILNGALYTGACGCAGEVGHIRLADYGPVGFGKQGSFEGFCSGSGIAQLGQTMAREMFQQGLHPSFCPSPDDINAINAKTIAEYAADGCEDAVAVYTQSAKMLGKGLAVIIDILNPEMIVIGSVFARCESLFRDEMQKYIDSECLALSSRTCKVVPALLGESIGDVAAISVAINGFCNGKCI